MSWKLHRQWNWLNRPQPRTSNHQYGLHLYLSIKHHLITVSALGGYKVCRSVEVLFLFSAWVELHQTLNIEHWTTKINRQTQTLLLLLLHHTRNKPSSIHPSVRTSRHKQHGVVRSGLVWCGEVWCQFHSAFSVENLMFSKQKKQADWLYYIPLQSSAVPVCWGGGCCAVADIW